MSVSIEVTYPNTSLTKDRFTIELPPTQDNPSLLQKYHVSCYVLTELKRLIGETKNIDPILQELSFGIDSGKTRSLNDDILTNSLFPKIVCHKRQRNPVNTLIINSFDLEEYPLNIDKNDTIIDVKFMLAKELGAKPEYLQLVQNFKKRIFSNTDNVVTCGLLTNKKDDSILHFWLELPSDSPNDSSFIVRSVVNLRDLPERYQNIGYCFRYFVDKWKHRPHLGTRLWNNNTRGDFKWSNFDSIGQRVTNIASGLVELGIKKGARIGICAANRAEWVLADYANHCQGFVTVPLYDTLSKNAIEYIVNHANVELIHCTKETLTEVLKAKKVCPNLKYVVLMDDQVPDQVWCQQNGATGGYTHRLSDIAANGVSNPKPDNFPNSDDLCTICYTSGTTGNPKGVMLTHRSLLITVYSFERKLGADLDENGVLISYLPLAHMYEKMMEIVALVHGSSIGYWCGDVLTLAEDIALLKPTYFAGVPRVYQRFQDKILSQVNAGSFIKRKLFNKAYDSKKYSIEHNEEPSHFWDKLVFSKIRDKFGGRITACVSGSAPLSATNANFLKICFTDRIVQGYGLTETSAAGSVSDREDPFTGHVGAIGTTVEMKLVNVPDMNYFVNDVEPRGEIWLRGPSIFEGYYKMNEKTNEVLTKDKWFATGDVGKWRFDGKLEIIDRKKNIFKLAQGEYVRPDYIENVYKQSTFVGNIFVHGNSEETYLIAIVVPDFEVLIPWAKQHGLSSISENLNELVKHPKVQQTILSDMDKIATREELTGFEKVKRITVITEDFTIDNGILTSTMKLKRNVARDVFKQQIKEMYTKVATSKM